jgi:hypothetical protein
MPDPHVLTTLRSKRDDIRDTVAAYEKRIAEAKRDLLNINATIRLFEVNGETPQFPVHMGLHRLFERGELLALCLKALKASPDGLDTRQLALAVVRAKSLDEGDKVLRSAVGYKIVTMLLGRRGRAWSRMAGCARGSRFGSRLPQAPEHGADYFFGGG